MLTKFRIVKAMVFPVVMYRCESWTIKETEHQRTDAFKLWGWRRVLRVARIPQRSNKSILKEINPDCSLEGLVLKLKLQYFGHLMQRTSSLEKTLMMGKIEDKRRKGCREWDSWIASPTQWTWVWANSARWWRTGKPVVLEFMGLQRVRCDLATEQQQHCINDALLENRHDWILLLSLFIYVWSWKSHIFLIFGVNPWRALC